VCSHVVVFSVNEGTPHLPPALVRSIVLLLLC
jgi:hypothetical protein